MQNNRELQLVLVEQGALPECVAVPCGLAQDDEAEALVRVRVRVRV